MEAVRVTRRRPLWENLHSDSLLEFSDGWSGEFLCYLSFMIGNILCFYLLKLVFSCWWFLLIWIVFFQTSWVWLVFYLIPERYLHIRFMSLHWTASNKIWTYGWNLNFVQDLLHKNALFAWLGFEPPTSSTTDVRSISNLKRSLWTFSGAIKKFANRSKDFPWGNRWKIRASDTESENFPQNERPCKVHFLSPRELSKKYQLFPRDRAGCITLRVGQGRCFPWAQD